MLVRVRCTPCCWYSSKHRQHLFGVQLLDATLCIRLLKQQRNLCIHQGLAHKVDMLFLSHCLVSLEAWVEQLVNPATSSRSSTFLLCVGNVLLKYSWYAYMSSVVETHRKHVTATARWFPELRQTSQPLHCTAGQFSFSCCCSAALHIANVCAAHRTGLSQVQGAVADSTEWL